MACWGERGQGAGDSLILGGDGRGGATPNQACFILYSINRDAPL